jgi:hypothetical protein
MERTAAPIAVEVHRRRWRAESTDLGYVQLRSVLNGGV